MYLGHDLPRPQVPHKAHLSRRTKDAPHGATRLRAKTSRVPSRVSHDHRLHLLAILQLQQQPPSGKVTLIYGAPRPEDLAYHPELLRVAEQCPWFELITTVDEPNDTWAGHTGPELDLLPDLVGERDDLVPMTCGKRDFVHEIRAFFQERGYDRKAVKMESYD